MEISKQYLEKALEIREKHLGVDHHETGKSYDHLATLLRLQNEFAEAEKLYTKAFDVLSSKLGTDNVYCTRVSFHQGILYSKTNRIHEAEKKFLQSIHVMRKLVHPDRSNALIQLANLYHQQTKLISAEMLFKEALEVKFLKLIKKKKDLILLF